MMDPDNIPQRIRNFDFEKLKSKDFYEENKELIVKTAVGLFFVLFFFYLIFLKAPSDFPVRHILHIEEGSNLNEIVIKLKQEKIIRYPSIFKFFTYISSNQKDLNAGDYFLDRKIDSLLVLRKLTKGDYGINSVNITFPEGVTVAEIGEILKLKFPDFNEAAFLRLAKDKEGFLFPDTYKFLPNVGPRQVIFEMEENFDNKIEPLLLEIEESNHSLKEIISMASLLEEEARTRKTREMISGILWKRIELGMLLQVDAVFPYIIGKNTFQLTLEDLQFDSPYNTYKYPGLPPGAISNPGLRSIESALRPTESNYLFYLSDRGGNMHYARNFEGHKRNKRIYLR